MKITIIIPLFSISGVPLAQQRFACALADKGHFVELLVGGINPECEFSPPLGIKTTILNKPNVRGMLFPLIKYFLIEKPDIVFSAEDHLNTMVLIAAIISGSKAKISCSSRVTPFDTYSNIFLSKRWVLKQLTRLVMGRANALTCVSRDMVAQYNQVFSSPPHVCVYNIVDDIRSRERMHEPVEHVWFSDKSIPVLVAAGRLAHWKGHANLIEAMSILLSSRPARLLILGDGPLRAELQDLIKALGLLDSVELVGYVENPLKYFARADVFVLSSLVEGLPNVLVEAMMCGCTPVSTDCPTGPREVLQNGKYGYLVPMRDPNAMAAAIERALEHPIQKTLLDEAVMPFEESVVIDRHFDVLGVTKLE